MASLSETEMLWDSAFIQACNERRSINTCICGYHSDEDGVASVKATDAEFERVKQIYEEKKANASPQLRKQLDYEAVHG